MAVMVSVLLSKSLADGATVTATVLAEPATVTIQVTSKVISPQPTPMRLGEDLILS